MPYVTKRKKIRSEVNTQVYTGPHNALSGRDLPNCHPIDAITGLQAALDELIDGAGTVGRVAGFTAEKTIGNTPIRFDSDNVGIGTDNLLELLNLEINAAEDVYTRYKNSNSAGDGMLVGITSTGDGRITVDGYATGTKNLRLEAAMIEIWSNNFNLPRVISGIASKRILGIDTTGKVEQTGVIYTGSGDLTARDLTVQNLTSGGQVNGATVNVTGQYQVNGVQIDSGDIAGLDAQLTALWDEFNDYLPLTDGITLLNQRTEFVNNSTQSYIYTTRNAGNPFPFDGTVNRNLIIQGRSNNNTRHIVFVTGNPPAVRMDINASRARFWQNIEVDGNLQVAGSTFLSSLSIGTHTNVVETQNEIIYTGNTATSSDITDITLPTGWDANKLAVVYAGVRGTQSGGASWFLHGSSAVDVRLFEVIDNPDVLRITVTQPSGVTLRDRAYRVILRRTVQ